MRRATSRGSSLASATWTGSAARACSCAGEAALDAGLLRRAVFHVRGGRGLVRGASRAGGRILFTPRAEVVHLAGARSQAGGRSLTALYDRSHLRVLREARPGWAPLLRWWHARCAAGAVAIESARSLTVRIAIDARKLHDYGIGTYVRNLVHELARQDARRPVRPAVPPRRRRPRRVARPAVRAAASSARATTRFANSSAFRSALARARVDLFHAPHYVVSPLTRVPVRRDDSRLHPSAVSRSTCPTGWRSSTRGR